jgi:tetratricopeptide (TPR) repeat protein
MSDALQLALGLLQNDRLNEALACFERLLGANPNDVATLSAYASALKRAAAVDARAYIDVEDAVNALRPAHCAAVLVDFATVVVRLDVIRGCIVGRPPAASNGVVCE